MFVVSLIVFIVSFYGQILYAQSVSGNPIQVMDLYGRDFSNKEIDSLLVLNLQEDYCPCPIGAVSVFYTDSTFKAFFNELESFDTLHHREQQVCKNFKGLNPDTSQYSLVLWNSSVEGINYYFEYNLILSSDLNTYFFHINKYTIGDKDGFIHPCLRPIFRFLLIPKMVENSIFKFTETLHLVKQN